MAKDIRVIMVKLADRLQQYVHYGRTSTEKTSSNCAKRRDLRLIAARLDEPSTHRARKSFGFANLKSAVSRYGSSKNAVAIVKIISQP